MGEEADRLIDQMFDDMFEYDYHMEMPKRRKSKRFQPDNEFQWKDSSDKVWYIPDMGDQHLMNTIKMLENKQIYPDKLKVMQITLDARMDRDNTSNTPDYSSIKKPDKASKLFNDNNDLDDEILF